MRPRGNQERRTNGFEPPFTAAQVATWIALPLMVIEFLLFVSPVLPLEASIPCTIVFGLTAVLAAYYAALATRTDPMDEHLARHLKEKSQGTAEETNGGFGASLGNPGEDVEPLKQCWICETQVAEHAMHCKFCNKCVGQFDHHCMWLNTCIGKANYNQFLWTMNYITLMLIVHCAVQIGLIVDIFLDGETKDRANDWFDAGASTVIVGVLIAFAVFDGIALSLIVQLLYFHMQLRREGLTTYKYIIRESQKKREKTNKEQERKHKRMVAMGKANDEGNFLQACKLRYGEMLPCCDPLSDEEEDGKKGDETRQPQMSKSSDEDEGHAPPQTHTSNGQASNGEAEDSNDALNEKEAEALMSKEEEENGDYGDTKTDENDSSQDGVQFVKVSQKET